MDVKSFFLPRGRFIVRNGSQSMFWEDLCVGNDPLMHQYPSLYHIARRKNQTVAHVLSTRPLNISFRRARVGDRSRLWLYQVAKIMNVELGDQDDSFVWCLTKHASFTVKSRYSDLMKTDHLLDSCVAWDLKIPLKIKIF